MKKFKIMLGLAVLCVVLCFTVFFIKNPLCYDSDYWGDIGLQGGHLYSDVVNQKGIPQDIIHTENESILSYDGVQFVWFDKEFKGAFIRADIVGDVVKLGKKELHIGSDKIDVINAYDSIFIKPIKDLPKDCIGYIDNRANIIYYLDNQDRVSKISVSIY